MLYMLRITGDRPAVVMLNGQPAGEIGESSLELPVGKGPLLIQAFPLQKRCFPVTAWLEIAELPVVRTAEGTLTLYVLSEKLLHAEVMFDCIKEEDPAMPYLLQRTALDSTGNLRGTVYFDRIFGFALEQNSRILLCGAFAEQLLDARIRRRGEFCLIEGIWEKGVELFLLRRDRESAEVVLHCRADSAELREDFLEYALPMEGGAVLRERYSFAENKVIRGKPEFSAEGRRDIFRALVYAVRRKDEEFAMSLIAPSLRQDAGFEDFCGFIGDFSKLYDEPLGESLGLCYESGAHVYVVRRLRAVIKNEQIWNIDEI